MIIAKIESSETRIFPTKTKTNFSVCFHLVSPEELLMRKHFSHDKKNRDKFIKNQLTKLWSKEVKDSINPAKLLSNVNQKEAPSKKSLLKQQFEVFDKKEFQRKTKNGLSNDDIGIRRGQNNSFGSMSVGPQDSRAYSHEFDTESSRLSTSSLKSEKSQKDR